MVAPVFLDYCAKVNAKKANTMNKDIEIVSDYRKGIAIARRQTWFPMDKDYFYHYDYFLIDENGMEVKNPRGGYGWESIHRFLDGYYYVTGMEKYDYRTFPGQDRDTEFRLRPVLAFILDERGTICDINSHLNNEKIEELRFTIDLGEGVTFCADTFFCVDDQKELDFNPLKYLNMLRKKQHQIENDYTINWYSYNFLNYKNSGIESRTDENGNILCGSCFFDLESLSRKFTLPKKIEPIGQFKNGRCKVGVVSDYRNFIVLASEKKIKYVFEEKSFYAIAETLGYDINSLRIEKYVFLQSYECKPAIEQNTKIVRPEIDVEIQGYELCMSFPYILNGSYSFNEYDENYDCAMTKFFPKPNRYLINGEWLELDVNEAQIVCNRIFEQKTNRPNYIKEINRLQIANTKDGVKYSMYKFKCRPYGYIYKNGEFDYSFDINNIKW